MSMGLTTTITGSWTGGLTLNMLDEQSGLLGSTYNANGPLNFGSSNKTSSLGISSGFALTDKTDLLLEASVARTNGSKNSSGLISSVSPLYTTSYGASLAERDLINDGDRLELTTKAPLKVVSGSASLISDTVADDGTPIVGSQNVSMRPTGTELDLGMSYRAPVHDSFEWNVSLTARHDVDNIAGNTDIIGVVGAKLTF